MSEQEVRIVAQWPPPEKKEPERVPEEPKQPDPQIPIPVDGFVAENGSLLQFDGYDRFEEPKWKTVLRGRSLQLLAHVVEGGAIVAVRALISFGDRPPSSYDIPTFLAYDSRKGAAALTEITGYPWTPEQVKAVGRWLVQASNADAPTIRRFTIDDLRRMRRNGDE